METIHMAVLDALYSHRESGAVVFHGGTCIRLVYGGHRYSEDLDFVSRMDGGALDQLVTRAGAKLSAMLPVMLGPGTVSVAARPERLGQRVRKWWVRYQHIGSREAVRVKIEIGAFPARGPMPAAVPARTLLPAVVPLVITVPAEELLADKVNALAQRPFIRGRDFFDIWFLRGAGGARLSQELVLGKFSDYGTNAPFDALAARKRQVSSGLLGKEMAVLLPATQRGLLSKDDYESVLESVRTTIDEVLSWR